MGTDPKTDELLKFLIVASEGSRNKLNQKPSNSYRDGFDVGYYLGMAHAYENVIRRLGGVPQNETALMKDVIETFA